MRVENLKHETQRNLEVMWSLRKLTPDCKTMADFREDKPQALKHVGREFTLLCKKLDLCGRELMAIDGSQLKAVNSKARNLSEKKMQQLLQHINDRLDASLKALDEHDTVEAQTTKDSAQDAPRKKVLSDVRQRTIRGI